MNIAVTGGSGAIGTYVCDELVEAGHKVTSLDVAPPKVDAAFREVDLTNLEETCKAVDGFDQIVHLAAIPDPYGDDPPETVIGVNTTLSYNVFEAARLKGVNRVIYGCSESSTGFGIHSVELVPQYVPIDEEHPLWPHETYSLSKHFGERIGANYAKAFGMEVISLRYMWVWMKRTEESIKNIVARARAGMSLDEMKGKLWFGAHIAIRDVARACAAAASFEFDSDADLRFESFFLSAKHTFYSIPTLDVLESIYGKCPPVKDMAYFEADPYAAVFDIRKAKAMLGWEPKFDWRDFEVWEL